MNKFGERIKELRLEQNKTRNELAKELNISVRTISYWENNERECDFDMLIKISKLFHVSIDFLLGIED